jgi:hypothetical protein
VSVDDEPVSTWHYTLARMRVDRRQVIEITVPRSHGRAGCYRLWDYVQPKSADSSQIKLTLGRAWDTC